ncbi:MAG: glycosyltransferase [Clostridia bacterium]
MLKKRIAIFFPYFTTGGGEVVTAWTIEALKDKCEVFLFTFGRISAEVFNKSYGTNLVTGDFKIIRPPFAFLLEKIPGGLLKYHLLIRYFKHFSIKFDVPFGTYKEADFGYMGIQYIHFPDLDLERYDLKLSFLEKLYYKTFFLKNLYKKFCYTISGYNENEMKKNVTLVNSVWTKEMVMKNFGINSSVVYPPVLDDFIKVEFLNKDNNFVCIGRISPVKEIKKIIEIIRLVRQAGFDVNLHIIGSVENNSYCKEVIALQKENPWIFLDGEVSREKLVSIISHNKYGINGRKDEHFGIGVVEMTKAGCIVFVPDGGGQVEIVDEPQLRYKNELDAAKKITEVLLDKNLQIKIQKNLLLQSRKFSEDNFKKDIREIVQEFIK